MLSFLFAVAEGIAETALLIGALAAADTTKK